MRNTAREVFAALEWIAVIVTAIATVLLLLQGHAIR